MRFNPFVPHGPEPFTPIPRSGGPVPSVIEFFKRKIDELFKRDSASVHYTPEEKTDEEKAIARDNIRAQEKLVSGVNLKTVRGQSLLGSGDVPQVPAEWGGIMGNLGMQTDLVEALGGKADRSDVYTKSETDAKITANVENSVTSTSTTKALSANMGKELQDQIQNLKHSKADEAKPSFSTITINGVDYTEWTLGTRSGKIMLSVDMGGISTEISAFNPVTGVFESAPSQYRDTLRFDREAPVVGTSPTLFDHVARESALSGKANISHTHTKSEITDFPASMPPTAHSHASDSWFTTALGGKVDSFSAVGGVTPSVSEGVANLSALFSGANTLLKHTIIDVAGEKVNIGVTAVTQDGVTVTGQTVYVHNGTSADDPVVASIAYNGQPVTLTVDKGIQYFVRISNTLAMHFNPTTASGYATADVSVTLTYTDVSTVTDLNDIAPALAAINDLAQARTLLVGKEFPDVWIDYDGSGSGDATPAQVDNKPAWNDPLILTDVQMVEDASGNTHLGAVLMRKYATRYDIVFDAANTEEATEETAQEGLYYYGLAKGATAPAAGNVTYLDLTAGDAIPYVDYEKVYRNTLRESFDATTKIVANNNVFRNGHNRYETSAYRQYLNSSAAKGEWWTQQHVGQMKPSSASNYCGYKRGCSTKLLSLIKPVKRRCVPNYVTDGGSSSDQDVGLYTVCDDFFLPCCGEMFGTTNNYEVFFNDEYNYQFTYWRDLVDNPAQAPGNNVAAINDVRKVKRINAKDGSDVVSARLRSAYKDTSFLVWTVNRSGYLDNNYSASFAFASVPACVIY